MRRGALSGNLHSSASLRGCRRRGDPANFDGDCLHDGSDGATPVETGAAALYPASCPAGCGGNFAVPAALRSADSHATGNGNGRAYLRRLGWLRGFQTPGNTEGYDQFNDNLRVDRRSGQRDEAGAHCGADGQLETGFGSVL
jgi:hypothetical protein